MDEMEAPTIALTDAQLRVLGTMMGSGRCVGGPRTEPQSGWVHTRTAAALVDLGLAVEELGATGARVFRATDEGRALWEKECDE